MKIEDYNKYYIQGSDHYLIPKDVFKELFNEMINWKEEAYDVTHKIKYNERSRRRMQKSLMEKINLLEDNWNKLKKIVKSQSGFKKRADLKGGLWFEIDELLDKMQELENGDSNE